MVNMHFFQKAKQTPLAVSNRETDVTAGRLWELLSQISDWAQFSPSVYHGMMEEKDVLYVLFNDLVFMEEDFWQDYGESISTLHARWKIHIFGIVASTQETVWMNLEQQGDHFSVVQKTISGRPAAMIQSLCLRIQCESPEQAERLQILFRAVQWEKGIVAVDWDCNRFLEEEKVPFTCQGCCFCYGRISEDATDSDYLGLLSFKQKMDLWSGFLEDDFDYTEFAWMYDEIADGVLADRSEWELALYMVMRKLGYTIHVSQHGFELYDGRQQRRYYNFDSRQYSQRAFLKILFPIKF
ncbi:MAG: hypothetical protein ACLU6B_10285 [Lachnospirales bacterium]